MGGHLLSLVQSGWALIKFGESFAEWALIKFGESCAGVEMELL